MSTPEPRGRLDPLVAHARRLVEPHLARGPVVLGVSGGADSLALASVTAHFARRGAQARAVVVDHGLQPGSAEVAARAVATCHKLGLDAEVVRVEVGTRGGTEAAARTARRAALLDSVEAGGRVLLAHTLDDQAETVLLGLGRGSGARSLRAMAVDDGQFVRPFLSLRRVETQRLCELAGILWWDDPHNLDKRFRRVRVRHEVLPLMEDVLGGGVAEALARTAAMLRSDDEALQQWSDSVSDNPRCEELAVLPEAVRRRVLKRLAIEAGAAAGELSAHHLAQMERIVMQTPPPGRIELPGAIAVSRDSDNHLRFAPTPVAG